MLARMHMGSVWKRKSRNMKTKNRQMPVMNVDRGVRGFKSARIDDRLSDAAVQKPDRSEATRLMRPADQCA